MVSSRFMHIWQMLWLFLKHKICFWDLVKFGNQTNQHENKIMSSNLQVSWILWNCTKNYTLKMDKKWKTLLLQSQMTSDLYQTFILTHKMFKSFLLSFYFNEHRRLLRGPKLNLHVSDFLLSCSFLSIFFLHFPSSCLCFPKRLNLPTRLLN